MFRDPLPFDESIFAQVCELLASGTNMRAICRMDGFPSYKTIYRWIQKDADNDSPLQLETRIMRARRFGSHALADETLEIADDATNDYMQALSDSDNEDDQNKSASWRLNGEHVQRSKLRVEQRNKLISKWNSGHYGDKIDVNAEHTGSISISWSNEDK